MKRYCCLVILLLSLCVDGAMAQRLTGLVQDPSGRAIPGVGVVVLSTDSTYLTASTTNTEGRYSIALAVEQYILTLQHTAYEPQCISGTRADMGTIILHPRAQQLGEVTVTAMAPDVQVTPDGALKYNVRALTQGRPVTNVLDMIEEVPGVERNGDSFRVLGTSSTAVIINGKRRQMSTSDVVQMLSMMSPDQVRGIEVFYNAPASTGVRGAAINVTLDRKRTEHTTANGNLYTDMYQGRNYYMVGGSNLMLSKRRWNWLLNYAAGNLHKHKYRDLDLQHTVRGVERDYGIHNTDVSKDVATKVVSDFNVDLGHKQNLDIFYSGRFSWPSPKQISSILDQDGNTLTRDQSLTDGNKQEHNATLEYTAPWLDATLCYTHYNQDRSQDMTSQGTAARRLLSESNQKTDLVSLELSRKETIRKAQIGYGLLGEWSLSHNSYATPVDEISIQDYTFRSTMLERNVSAYLTWGQRIGKQFTLSSSLEVEYSRADYDRKQGESTVLWEHVNFYPSLTATWKVSPLHVLQAVVKSSKNYPSYWASTPNVNYYSSNWINRGNPELKPYNSYQVNLTYILRSKYQLGAGVALNPDVFSQVTYQDTADYRLVTQYFNLHHSHAYNVFAVVPIKWCSRFTTRVTAQGSLRSTRGQVADVSFDRQRLTGSLALRNDWILDRKKAWSLQVNASYQLPTINGFVDVDGYALMSAALAWRPKSLPIQFTLKGADLLGTSVVKTHAHVGSQHFDNRFDNDARQVVLNLKWNWGGYKERKTREVNNSRFGM